MKSNEVVLEGIHYFVLGDSADIERYVLATSQAEWDSEDFEQYGQDLHDQVWHLAQVPVKSIRVLQHQLDSAEFIADVTPRIEQQRRLHCDGIAVPPLILRGHDHLIFDGYARWHLFSELGIRECLAYVSRSQPLG